jgi:hypothetical protein
VSPKSKVLFYDISHFRHRIEAEKPGLEANLDSGSIAISTVFSTGVENFGKRPNAHPVSAGASEEIPAGADGETRPGSAKKS